MLSRLYTNKLPVSQSSQVRLPCLSDHQFIPFCRTTSFPASSILRLLARHKMASRRQQIPLTKLPSLGSPRLLISQHLHPFQQSMLPGISNHRPLFWVMIFNHSRSLIGIRNPTSKFNSVICQLILQISSAAQFNQKPMSTKWFKALVKIWSSYGSIKKFL